MLKHHSRNGVAIKPSGIKFCILGHLLKHSVQGCSENILPIQLACYSLAIFVLVANVADTCCSDVKNVFWDIMPMTCE